MVAALVVEATEENTSESDRSLGYFLETITTTEVRWKWACKSRTRRAWSAFKIQSKVNLCLMGRSIRMDAPPASNIVMMIAFIIVSVTKRRKVMWLHIGLPVRFGTVTSITVCVSALIRLWIRPLGLNSQEVEINSSIYFNESNSYMESTL